MLAQQVPLPLVVVIDVVAWGLFHAVTGYLAHRLPRHRLENDGWLLRTRAFEDARFYRDRLRIHRWKDRLPEAGNLFAGGVSKRELASLDDDGLEAFTRETRRAELGHWWAMACAPLFVLWNPPLPSVLLVAYGVLVNLPFIAIQRYNRLRITGLLGRRRRRGPTPPAT
ncbi:hypothetical protein [Knoellia flava]|uniref:Glycosyl-4,4'-diaponeurosporenoate acyltransferase n=2 Tax=Knoellia flava TaxID=913969 RepID=A0A8H9FRL9_9MICO|nr:hypothetical protein [Knoellia flava]GGB74470.1 hypothetical protein GCM10011314_12450 [Knoellia flava]